MNHNPYTPPSARVADAAETVGRAGSTARLYTPGQIALAAFLGSPLAAAWFAAANFKALAQPFKATRHFRASGGALSPAERELASGFCGLNPIDAEGLAKRYGTAQLEAAANDTDLAPYIRGRANLALKRLGQH